MSDPRARCQQSGSPRPRSSSLISWILPAIVLACQPEAGFAEAAFLIPVADATLIEVSPTNSLGGAEFVNAGTTQNYTRNRGLLRFDPAASIPLGARITRASLTVAVTRRPKDGFRQATMELHRMLQPWGEGRTLPELPDTSPGLGGPADVGDATWTHRFFGTDATWATPGGAEGIDYVQDASSSTIVLGVEDSPYTFESTRATVNDVQTWLDHPSTNFGWMLRTLEEGFNFTARRFASRETVDPPRMQVEYTPPMPAPSLTVLRPTEGAVLIGFQAEANTSYRLEGAGAPSGAEWTLVEEFPAASEPGLRTQIVTAEGKARYFRLQSF